MFSFLSSSPPTKSCYKMKVLDWWQTHRRTEAALLPSLSFFQAHFMSLSSPHPIWTSAGSSSYEVIMLSGRYRTCWLRRFWSDDISGSCQIPGCSAEPGNLLHIAWGQCPGLQPAKIRAVALWKIFLEDKEILFPTIKTYSLGEPELFLKLLVDPTSRPDVISLAQAQPLI